MWQRPHRVTDGEVKGREQARGERGDQGRPWGMAEAAKATAWSGEQEAAWGGDRQKQCRENEASRVPKRFSLLMGR